MKSSLSFTTLTGKAKVEWGTGEAMDTSDSRLYYEVAISSWERYISSNLW